MARDGGKKNGRLADMSVPPELRAPESKKQSKAKKSVPAQMSHGQSPKAAKRRREGEKKLRRSRLAAPLTGEADTDLDPGEQDRPAGTEAP